MNGFELEQKANHIPYLRGIFMTKTLPFKPRINESAIVNLDTISGQGTHWVCNIKRGNYIFYFDSFRNLTAPIELIKYSRVIFL